VNLNATLVVQVLSFLILLYLLVKVLYRPLNELLENRQKQVRQSIEDSQRLLAEAERKRIETQRLLHQAQEEASLIRRKAQEAADTHYKEQVRKTKEDIARMLEDADKEIAEQVRRAKIELQREVAGLSVDIAQKVLHREIKLDDHKQIVREAIEGIVNG